MSTRPSGATAGEAASGALRVHSLSGLETASALDGRVVWDAPRSRWNVAIFGTALAFAPATLRSAAPITGRSMTRQASNVCWLAIPTMGEAWHGNYHVFPCSARHGLYPG